MFLIKILNLLREAFLFRILISFLLFLFTFSNAFAQQTIFNVPSADIPERGKLFVEHESQFSGKFGLFTDYFALGVGKHTSLNLTLSGVGTRTFRNETLGLGFKTVLPLNERTETKFTFGHLIPVSLRGSGVGGYSYSHLSTRLPRIKTRITSGVLIGTTVLLGRDVVAYIGGVEQPITKKLNLLLDYTSGNHSNGLLIGGFSYQLPANLIFISGYQIPNNRQSAKKGFVIEVAKYF